MTQINQSSEADNNIHLSNKDNFTIIMDYSNENSISPINSKKNLHFNNRNSEKEKENKKTNENKNIYQKDKIEEKIIKSSRSQSNSLNKKERKIISIIENNSGNKDKKIKFNELPPLNRPRNINIKKNGADINITNINLDYKNKIDLNNTLKRRVDELNSELSKLKNEPNIQNFNTLENNYKLMSKELEELKHENSYIKNKLEEIYQKQNPKIKENKNINSSKSKN